MPSPMPRERDPASRPIVRALAAACLLAALAHLQARAAELGHIDFPTSGSPPAQESFLTGVLLLHSFEYEDAAEAFRAAEQREPGFAMAYWGEAMTYNHPIWLEQDLAAARGALGRLAPTPEARLAKAPTAREKAYLGTVEILFGEGDKAARDRAYAAALQRLHEAWPDDLEAASFYALALLGSCGSGRDAATYMRAAAVVEEVFARSSRHPGAAHYLIHSYDDPIHAPLGLRPARAYAGIAPAAAHALHMPSHIFLALGMWDDVAASNEASWAASDARRQRRRLALEARGYHALSWLAYARLQQGRYREARRLLAIMEEDARQSGSARTGIHLAAMRNAYLIETRRWTTAIASAEASALGTDAAAADVFTRGLAALESGDRAAARRQLAALEELLAAAKDPAPGGSSGAHSAAAHGAGISGQASYSPREPALKAGQAMAGELAAILELAAGHREQAIALLDRAAALEDGMSFEFGPPVIVKPAHELAGEALLSLDRPAEARRHFELALARAPRRALSLLGLARAAARAGDREAARRAYADLRRSWSQADTDLPELAELARETGREGVPAAKIR